MLCISQNGEDTGTDTACLGAGPGNLVCVNSLGGIRIRVTQFIGSGYGIDTVGNQNGCYRVTESMGMDVGQVVGFAEFVQPVGDAVGMHSRAIIFSEYESGILPDVTMTDLGAKLLCLPLLQLLRNGKTFNNTSHIRVVK